ncbi:hypothetical protein CHS0354_026450 [Potamilus streckersoni]|uniref:Myb-like, SWIRM and MPN domain-containing protein 1 n=1 Tax=Potamilus streckersoni TaxID=2493646 RepID=A0AAE0RPX6_9BIVA|nr:hypothetical protein CHS0354_026450 [Potamilus streckersoni]
MADDGDIDIEGDFDFAIESDIYDTNELPSKSANLLPEYINPPWMLEQDLGHWTLDSNIDEKSKATIEKMLLEEQQYINGRNIGRLSSNPSRKKDFNESGVIKSPTKDENVQILQEKLQNEKASLPSQKRLWSDEEKQLFLKGLELYGRSWTKIASLIPSRTSLQIKNYAHQYFRLQTKLQNDSQQNEQSEGSDDLNNQRGPPDLDTGQPTILVSPLIRRGGKLSKPSIPESPRKKQKTTKSSYYSSSYKCISEEDAISNCNAAGKSGPNSTINSADLHTSSYAVGLTSFFKEDKLGAQGCTDFRWGKDKDDKVNEDKIETGVNGSTDNYSDEDIDVDVLNDDEAEVNPILNSRSTSPNSVYERLLQQANVSLDDKKNADLFGSSKENVAVLCNGHLDGGKNASKFVSKISRKTINCDETINDSLSNESVVKILSDGGTSQCVGDLMSGETTLKDITSQIEGVENGNSPACFVMNYTTPRSESTNEYKEVEEEKDTQEESQPHIEGEAVCIPAVSKQYVNAVVTYSGEVIEFPIPQEEKYLDPNAILPEEKEVHSEFFDGRPSKTPQRYLRIRNYILDSWKKCRPNYLNKTSVRPGLKNCGDVNCIGRIHGYLESTGVINFGCEQVVYNNPGRVVSPGIKERVPKAVPDFRILKTENMRPRKRRIKNADGFWVDEKELEGRTIQHLDKTEADGMKQKITKQTRTVYDPFKLVPCQSFTAYRVPPFAVEIDRIALMVMDMHAHISKTEVIGMLGGRYCQEQGTLKITMATPCNSLSTGMQCEMDPVSQTQAQTEINTAGMSVVGWYHSHPTFAPNPSIRDIETQLKFQEWFAKGGHYFVGIIVSPYNYPKIGPRSDVCCLTVGEEVHDVYKCNIPYKFEYSVQGEHDDLEISLLTKARSLVSQYASYTNRVDLSAVHRATLRLTRLDKMMNSLEQYLTEEEKFNKSGILQEIRTMFSEAFSAYSEDSTDLVS